MSTKTTSPKLGSCATSVKKASSPKDNSSSLWISFTIQTFLKRSPNKWRTWSNKLKKLLGIKRQVQLSRSHRRKGLLPRRILLKREHRRMCLISLEMRVSLQRTVQKWRTCRSQASLVKARQTYLEGSLQPSHHPQFSRLPQPKKSLHLRTRTHCSYYKESKQ